MMLKHFCDWLVPGSRISFWAHLLLLGLLTLAGLHLQAWHEYRTGELLMTQHKYADARPHFERCLLVWPESVPLKLHLARAERIAGSMEKADQYLRELRLSNQPLPDTYRIETLLLDVNQGYIDDVEAALYDFVRNNHPESPAIFETLVMFNLKVRNLHRAAFLLGQWQKIDPNQSLVYELRGNCFAMQGQVEVAINELVHALELNPDSMEARMILCDMYLASSKLADAAPHVRFLADHYADNRFARLVIVRYLIDTSRFEEADQQLSAILDQYPNDHSALAAQATSYYRRNDYEHALQFLRPAAAQNSFDSQVVFMLERCLTALNDPELPRFRAKLKETRARETRLREINDALLHGRRIPTVEELLERSQIYFEMNNESAGMHDLSTVLKRSPNNRRALQLLADYYTSKNDPVSASKYLKRVQALPNPGPSPASK